MSDQEKIIELAAALYAQAAAAKAAADALFALAVKLEESTCSESQS